MKKYKKSSELFGKKLVIYSTIMAGTLIATAFTLNSCNKETTFKDKEVVFDSVDDDRPVVLINNDLKVELDNYEKKINNMDEARKIIASLNSTDFTNVDDNIKQEIIDDNITTYFFALQTVNKSNPFKDFDMEKFFLNNYEKIQGKNRETDTILSFNALAYQRLIDNNVDMNLALDELNKLMILQTNPVDMDQLEYQNTFKNLLSTIDESKHESLYDIYFSLAYDLHLITCDMNHENDITINCDNLEEEYKTFSR